MNHPSPDRQSSLGPAVSRRLPEAEPRTDAGAEPLPPFHPAPPPAPLAQSRPVEVEPAPAPAPEPEEVRAEEAPEEVAPDELPWLSAWDSPGEEAEEEPPTAEPAEPEPAWPEAAWPDPGSELDLEPAAELAGGALEPWVEETPAEPVEIAHLEPAPAQEPADVPEQPPAPAAGEPPVLLDEVAARLEGIARTLRERRTTDLLSGGAADPLEILITGYALGYTEAQRQARGSRKAPE